MPLCICGTVMSLRNNIRGQDNTLGLLPWMQEHHLCPGRDPWPLLDLAVGLLGTTGCGPGGFSALPGCPGGPEHVASPD